MPSPTRSSVWAWALTSFLCIDAISLDLNDPASIKTAAHTVAGDLLGYYSGTQPGQPIGIFDGTPGTYQNVTWGETGAIWGSLIDYWNYTGDAQYNSIVQQALLYQVGPNNDYMTPNQTKSEGNDDQGLWALAAMTAAEQQFPSPLTSVTWLDLAKNVFDLQAARWDTANCGGGLRWQIFTFNNGYDYKQTFSTGVFFQLAARLARFTGNQTYADWAEKSYDWTTSVGLISTDFKVYDGASITSNCSQPVRLQWTYVAADFLYGSAVMYNFTNGNSQWQNRTQSLLSAMSVFFSDESGSGIMVEVACEPQDTCVLDQYSFKGLAAQWLGSTMQVASFTTGTIASYLQKSASGAAASCSGGTNGTACGSKWTTTKFDGTTGIGQELSALNVILANLAAKSSAPVTSNTTTTVAATTSSASSGSTISTSQEPPGSTSSTSSSGKPSPAASSDSLRLLPWNIIGQALSLSASVTLIMWYS